jgi:hypothetical protein
MRKFFLTAFTLAAVVVLATSAFALEKTSKPMLDPSEDWGAANTVTVRYYNTCTGWLWVWSGWADGEAMGVCVDAGCHPGESPVISATWALTFSPMPSGYGFTGTISIQDNCDCTGTVLAAQPFLPISGWTGHAWGVSAPQQFLVHIAWGAPTGFANATRFATDHPATGPTGPQSCGNCFPTTRVVHSEYYGVGGAYCPGTSLNDGICDVEFLVDTAFKCTVSVEEASWGQIKNLYQ